MTGKNKETTPAKKARAEREKKVIDCVRENPTISNREGAKLCNMSEFAFRKWRIKNFSDYEKNTDYDISQETRKLWKEWEQEDNERLDNNICVINLYGEERRRYERIWERRYADRCDGNE